jgi:hypothetical protein
MDSNLNWGSPDTLDCSIAQIRLFIILYNHYLLKIAELENQVLKLRFKFKLIIWQFVAEIVKVLWYFDIPPNL